MTKNKSKSDFLGNLLSSKKEKVTPEFPKPTPPKKHASQTETETQTVAVGTIKLTPALPELGTTPCPVCKRRVTVFITKTNRPWINCGYCSARVFYNGSAAIRRLKRQLNAAKKGPSL